MITTIAPDILAKIRAAVLGAGETDSNDYLHEQLHETAQDRAEEILREHCPDIQHLDELDDDQRTELIQAYKDGFWEPCHHQEREALKAVLVRIRDYPAGSNSDPDVMGDAIDEIQRLAREVLV